jgi:hypothetical protein
MSTPQGSYLAALTQTVRAKTVTGGLSPEEAQRLLIRLQEYVAEVPSEEATKLIVQLSAILLSAGARLSGSADGQGQEASSAPDPDDRLLSVNEAAIRLNVNRRWLYANHHRLPFAKKLSRKALRFSERGLERWLQRGRPGVTPRS